MEIDLKFIREKFETLESNQEKIIELLENQSEAIAGISSTINMLEQIYDGLSKIISQYHSEEMSCCNSVKSTVELAKNAIIQMSKNIEKIIALLKAKKLPTVE